MKKRDTRKALQEITEELEQGVREIFESDRFKDYLQTMSRFTDYSINNIILIAMQKPDASLDGLNLVEEGKEAA